MILFLEGIEIIKTNEFKTKWLLTFNETARTLNLMSRMFKPIIIKY